MIFKNIKEINDKKLKATFIEKIDLHIRIVESIAELNKLNIEKYKDSIEEGTIDYLIEFRGKLSGKSKIKDGLTTFLEPLTKLSNSSEI